MTAWLERRSREDQDDEGERAALDDLALAERFAFGFHLAACRGCRAYIGELQASIEIARALPAPAPAPPVTPRARTSTGRHSAPWIDLPEQRSRNS